MGKLYLLNTLIVPVDFEKHLEVKITLRRISIDEARELVKIREWVSAIGHEGTARLLSVLLGIEIPFQRIAVYLEPEDEGLHFVLRERLPEGVVLSYDELIQKDFWLVYSKVKK